MWVHTVLYMCNADEAWLNTKIEQYTIWENQLWHQQFLSSKALGLKSRGHEFEPRPKHSLYIWSTFMQQSISSKTTPPPGHD